VAGGGTLSSEPHLPRGRGANSYAEELGFDAVWLAEHHFTRFGIVPSAIPFATYVAARTKKIRIGTGVSVLTFHHPVFMAEETAMLDVLSQGRLDFGVGRGQVVYEYNNFKVEYDSRTRRFQEIVDIILGLWQTPGFTYHGQYYSVDDLTIAPVPVQQPHPPMYLAVSRTPASVQVAVSRQLPILTSANTPDEDVLGIRAGQNGQLARDGHLHACGRAGDSQVHGGWGCCTGTGAMVRSSTL